MVKIAFGFVPFPREIWENPVDLSLAEFRLLGWFLARLKLGIKQSTYTDNQILTGADGLPGVRVSRNSFKEARTSLVTRRYLTVTPTSDPGKYTYCLYLGDDEQVSISDTQVSISDTQNAETVSIFDTYNIKESETETEKSNHLPLNGTIPRIFEFFRSEIGKSPNYTLTKKREKMGEARFREAQAQRKGDPLKAEFLMCGAIKALGKSDWHMGRDPKNQTEYNDWEQIFRSPEKFQSWIEKAGLTQSDYDVWMKERTAN